jgi:hypothetical protein
MSFYSHDDKTNLKFLLGLLEKAEQILGLINLPDTTLHKYNQLKEITFNKLNLDYRPVEGKKFQFQKTQNNSMRNFNNTGNNLSQDYNNNILIEHLNRLRLLNVKKTAIVEYLFDLIEKFKYEGSNHMRQHYLDNQNFNLEYQLEKSISNMNDLNKSLNLYDDLDFELKLEDLKLKDFIGKSDICYRKFLSELKNYESYNNNNYQGKSNIIRNAAYEKIEGVIGDYEKKIEELKWEQEREMKEYREKYNELRIKYNPELESEYFKLRDSYDAKTYIIDETTQMIDPIYEKYFSKNLSWYEKVAIDYKYNELIKVHFLSLLVNKFFSDNKYLLDMLSDVQKEKNVLNEERNLPFVINAIQKNSSLQEINNELNSFEQNNDLLYKNIDQMIDYMSKNIENIS